MTDAAAGPLSGLRVLEFAGIGPGPHCAMMLADLGAEILCVERREANGWPNRVLARGRPGVGVDIRTDEGRAFCIDAAESVDVLIEGFRPGVMERLGLGPEVLLGRNPRLIYGRMTGWGQDGPLAKSAGHDINYIALTGALAAIGRPGSPAVPPLNLVGDFGGGSMLLAFGIMAALWERERSGKGQVIDAAIIDGVTSLMAMFSGLVPFGRVSIERERSALGGAAPFYRCYICADGKEIAVGALEPHFYRQLIDLIDAPLELRERQSDPVTWDERAAQLAEIFARKTRDEWCAVLEGTDACFAPVLAFDEAPDHPQMRAREVYVEHDGMRQAAPSPRFSRTPGKLRKAPHAEAVLEAWGVTPPGSIRV